MSFSDFKANVSSIANADDRKDRDEKGFFILTEETPEFNAPDFTLSKEEQIMQALEIFNRSFEREPNEHEIKYVSVAPKR